MVKAGFTISEWYRHHRTNSASQNLSLHTSFSNPLILPDKYTLMS